MTLKLTPRVSRSRKKAQPEPEDPIVAYDLYLWMYDRVLKTVETSDRYVAQQEVYELRNPGPFTSKDIDLRSVRKSEMERRRCMVKT